MAGKSETVISPASCRLASRAGAALAVKRRRALIVTDCGLRWATGMVRAVQFQPFFQSSDSWHAEFVSRHPEHIIKLMYGDHPLVLRILIRALRPSFLRYYERWSRKQDERIVELAQQFDLVCFVKTPSLPLYRRLLCLRGPRIIMDINDSLWLHKNDDWKDLDGMLSEVHGVICENEHLARYAEQYNSRIFVISDVPQVEVFDRYRDQIKRDPRRVVLGWIGSEHNIWPLVKIVEPLEALFARYPNLHLRVVGARDVALPRFENVRLSCLPNYSQEDMAREVLGFDIGLFPLFRNEDGRGRGTLKAKVYMSGEAVAMCEDYGENPKLIKDGINGVLVSSQHDWEDKLEWLITHPQERSEIARRGLETIREAHTAQHAFNEITSAFEEVLRVQ